MYELKYTNKDGKEVIKVIRSNFTAASQLARNLAISTGRRASISKKRENTYRVYLYNPFTRRRWLAWNDLTKDEVMIRFAMWNDRETEAFMQIEPAWYAKESRPKSPNNSRNKTGT